jgi:hypothetical protein
VLRGAYRTIPHFPIEQLIPELFGDAELATRLDHGQSFANLNLDRPQMADNLLGRIPFPCHAVLLLSAGILTPDST